MLVVRRPDGSLRFDGATGCSEIIPVERVVINRPANGFPIKVAFAEVQQVGLSGPPFSFLAISLQLRGGRHLELGRAPTEELAVRVARSVGEAIGCPVGGIVRLADSAPHTGRTITGTIFVDVIQAFDDRGARSYAGPAPPRPRARMESGTDEVESTAILREVPDVSDLIDVTDLVQEIFDDDETTDSGERETELWKSGGVMIEERDEPEEPTVVPSIVGTKNGGKRTPFLEWVDSACDDLLSKS